MLYAAFEVVTAGLMMTTAIFTVTNDRFNLISNIEAVVLIGLAVLCGLNMSGQFMEDTMEITSRIIACSSVVVGLIVTKNLIRESQRVTPQVFAAVTLMALAYVTSAGIYTIHIFDL